MSGDREHASKLSAGEEELRRIKWRRLTRRDAEVNRDVELQVQYMQLMDRVNNGGEQFVDKEHLYPLPENKRDDDALTFMLTPTKMLVEYEDSQSDTMPHPSGEDGYWSPGTQWLQMARTKRRFTRTATNGWGATGKPTVTLHSFISNTGVYYELSARLLGPRMMYSVGFSTQYDHACMYDGEDFEDAFEMFCELMIALKGLAAAESAAAAKERMKSAAETLREPSTDMTLKKAPLLFGDSNFAIY